VRGGRLRSPALHTSDGGTTWTKQSVPPNVSFLSAVACPTVKTCVAVGSKSVHGGHKQVGVVIRTHNGGATWTIQRIPPGLNDLSGISCPSVSDCEAVGDGDLTALGTTDGGAAWTPQGVPSSVESLAGVACPSVSDCEAVGLTGSGDGAAVGTTDGGATWTLQRLPGA
jgi:photosystem II stability/assembly factor-like uncharacterized protein